MDSNKEEMFHRLPIISALATHITLYTDDTAVYLKPLHGKVQLFEACLWRKHLRCAQRCLH